MSTGITCSAPDAETSPSTVLQRIHTSARSRRRFSRSRWTTPSMPLSADNSRASSKICSMLAFERSSSSPGVQLAVIGFLCCPRLCISHVEIRQCLRLLLRLKGIKRDAVLEPTGDRREHPEITPPCLARDRQHEKETFWQRVDQRANRGEVAKNRSLGQRVVLLLEFVEKQEDPLRNREKIT